MNLTDVKENLVTLQLLVVCILQTRGKANKIVDIEIDVTTGSRVTTH